MSIVRITDLFKEYGKGDASVKAVNHVSLAIEKGEFLTIVGTSGSGKTTLLNLMGGLDYPDGGKVVIEGQDITGMKSDDLTIFRRKKIGFIFQNYNLISSLNIRENILLTIKLDNKRADRDFLDTVVETLGLQDKLNRYPNQLSGGQQQRTAIARALISKPAIILADEPTGNLDTKTSGEVLGLLSASCKKFGQTLVMITHNDEIAKLADRSLRIEDGLIKSERQGMS